MFHIAIIKVITFLCLSLLFGIYSNEAWAETEAQASSAPDPAKVGQQQEKLPTKDELLSISDYDIMIGDAAAPVTMFEYSSLSCPHCANFHKEDFEKLNSSYIDKKLVRYIHRDFPTSQPALVGSVLARCSNQYEKYLNILFNSQAHWAYTQDYKEVLRGIAKLGGMDNTQIDSCFNDTAISDRIYQNTVYAAKVLGVKSTPTFFVNGVLIEGAKYSKLSSEIDSAIAEMPKK